MFFFMDILGVWVEKIIQICIHFCVLDSVHLSLFCIRFCSSSFVAKISSFICEQMCVNV